METQQSEEIIITWEKFFDNLKRYWWIILVTILLGVLILSMGLLKREGPKRSFEVEGIMYLQLIRNEVKDNTEALDNYVDAYEENSLESSGEVRIKSIIKLMSSRGTIQEITQGMVEQGFEDYQFDAQQVKLTVEGRLLIVSLQGTSKEETLKAAEIYLTVLQKKINTISDNMKMTIVQDPVSSAVEENVSSQSKTIDIMEKVFVFVLCLLAAFIGIFICTMCDKRFRNKNEVEALSMIPLLGQVNMSGDNKESIAMTSFLLSQRFVTEGSGKSAVIGIGDKKITEEFLEHLVKEASIRLKDIKLISISNLNKSYLELEENDISSVVLVVGKNDAKIKEVGRAVNILKVMNKTIIGIIYGN